MILSILICSHTARKPLLERMRHHLMHQLVDGVEVLTAFNNDYMERGKTRNSLLDRAKGKYCCFVDDDDVVSDDYVAKILKALEFYPDICGISGRIIQLKCPVITRDFYLSVQYNEPLSLPIKGAERDDPIIFRYSSHLCPIRTKVAQFIRFPENNKHEDNGYSERLKQVGPLKETMIDGLLYYYFYRANLL